MKRKTTILCINICLLILLFSCSKNEEIKPDETIKYENLFNNKIEVKNKNGEVIKSEVQAMVLTMAAYISGEARTVGEGMPMKFYFSYDKKKPEELILEFKKFHYGNMPLKVNFRANIKLLSADDKEGLKRVRLYCNNANTAIFPVEIEATDRGNSKVDGYFYPETQEIEMFINFNMMNVTAYSKKQKIDLTRILRYDEEMDEYIKMAKEVNK